VTVDTPATVLSDGDAGLWRLQREALPNATVVLDWWHIAVRFEHALQAARGLGATDAHLAAEAVRGLERAKWRLWHGRWPGCRRKLAALCRWARRTSIRSMAGIGRLEHHVGGLLAHLERNQGALVHYAARRRNGEPISTAFVESLVNEIIAKTHEQEAANAPEQGDGAVLPQRANSGVERYAPGRLPSVISRLPPYKRLCQRSRHGHCSIACGICIRPRREGLARWNALGAARQLFWNGVSAPPRVTAGSAVAFVASSSTSEVVAS
jgi:hypothetical protein